MKHVRKQMGRVNIGVVLRKIKLPLISRQSSPWLAREKQGRKAATCWGPMAWKVKVQEMGRGSGDQFRGEAPPAGSHSNHFQPPLPHRLNLNITALVSGCHWGNDFRARWPAAIFFFPQQFPCWKLLKEVGRAGWGRLPRTWGLTQSLAAVCLSVHT